MPSPTLSQSPTPSPDGTRAEAVLLERLGPTGCMPWRGEGAPTGRAVEAAVLCQPDDGPAARITLVTMRDREALREAWSGHVDGIEPSLEESSTACEGSTTGVRRWGFGRLACSLDDGSATISWTDTRSRLHGVVQAPGPDFDEIHTWWEQVGRPLGRIADQSPAPSGRRPGRSSIRVPGAPDDVICTSLDEPIVDPHGRTWRVARVRFIDEAGHERVMFALRRTGPVRPRRSAQVTIDRMPVADVASEVPGASRPGRGRTALVVRMDGVTEAPALQAYRPDGLDMIRELSILGGNRSRTAILSLNGEGCYQVRIPAFGPSASGDEDRAELFIDIQR